MSVDDLKKNLGINSGVEQIDIDRINNYSTEEDESKQINLEEKDFESYWHFLSLGISMYICYWFFKGDGLPYIINYLGDSGWFMLLVKYSFANIVMTSPVFIYAIIQQMNNKQDSDDDESIFSRNTPLLIVFIFIAFALGSFVFYFMILSVFSLLFVFVASKFGSYWWIWPPTFAIMITPILKKLLLSL